MRSRRPKRRRRKSEAITLVTLHAVPGTTLLSTETGGRGEPERMSQQAGGVPVGVWEGFPHPHSLFTLSQAAHAYRI